MSYSNMNGLELFGDPFSRPQTYSQSTSRNSYSKATTTTQPKTTATQPEPVKTQVQQPSTNPVTQPEPPVLQQNSGNPILKSKSVTSVPTEKTTPVDTKSVQTKKELVMDMSGSDTDSKAISNDIARKAHEEAENKRKAAWEAKQCAKKQAEEAALKKLKDMSDDDVIAASIERVSTDVERITRRNMKECVAAHIQELARKDAAFARRTMHPRKNMVNCFKYINHRAKEFVEQEMKDNDIDPDSNGYGTDVPDNIVYHWGKMYFFETDLPEDQEKEEKFVPKPYVGTTSKTSSKPKKTASKAKKAEKSATKEVKKNQEAKDNYQQMSLF